MTVNDVFTQVSDCLLEPVTTTSTGLQLGLVSQQQFLDYFSDVFMDFLERSRLTKKLIALPVTAGTSQYTEPDSAMEVEEALFNERYIHREDAGTLDDMRYNWRGASGAPQLWHEDRLPIKTIELEPKPNATGYTVPASANFYGTLSSTSGPVDFDILSTSNLYGTICSYTSAVYLETTAALFGTISNIATSSLNLTLVATGKPPSKTFVLGDLIQFVPDSFVLYLKYGILEKIFSMDGEAKDELRARYCGARYLEGINIAKAIMQEAVIDQGGF